MRTRDDIAAKVGLRTPGVVGKPSPLGLQYTRTLVIHLDGVSLIVVRTSKERRPDQLTGRAEFRYEGIAIAASIGPLIRLGVVGKFGRTGNSGDVDIPLVVDRDAANKIPLRTPEISRKDQGIDPVRRGAAVATRARSR